jgi:hypothetical protein
VAQLISRYHAALAEAQTGAKTALVGDGSAVASERSAEEGGENGPVDRVPRASAATDATSPLPVSLHLTAGAAHE